MGIIDSAYERQKKTMKLDFETSNFKNIGYWIKSLKQRFKKCEIQKISSTFVVEYIEKEEEEDNE